jgi:hypothetical protein
MYVENEWRMQALRAHYLGLLDKLGQLKRKKAELEAGVVRQRDGAPRIRRPMYLLKHPRPDYSGQYGPISFSIGRGSTSSLRERDQAVDELGCVDISDELESGKSTGINAVPSDREIQQMEAPIMHTATVYVLRHPDQAIPAKDGQPAHAGFTGQQGAITFSNGLGSTSSATDRDAAVRQGCVDVTAELDAANPRDLG